MEEFSKLCAWQIGSNLLLGPGGYISLSGPGMLTHQGRPFAPDDSRMLQQCLSQKSAGPTFTEVLYF